LRICYIIRSSSSNLVPARREFVSNAGLECEIGTQLDCVFEIPRSEETSPSQLIRIRHRLKRSHGSLQERLQAGKAGLTQLSRCGVLIVPEPLKPNSSADLMNPLVDLQTVRISKKISAIP